MNRFLTLILLGGILAYCGCGDWIQGSLDLPTYTHEYDRTEETQVPMGDGKKLVTHILFPEGEGPWPVILFRNPYNAWNSWLPTLRVWTRYGYVVVHQDVRGRFDSEGEWTPLENEGPDGLDTVNWILKQPWQNRNIGLWGASYLSAVQWAMGTKMPPEVKTMVSMVFGTDFYSAVYENGNFRHDVFTFWAALMADHKLHLFNGDAYQDAIRHYPPKEVDKRYFGLDIPWYRQWQQSEEPSAPMWQQEKAKVLAALPDQMDKPVLMITGWYDLFIKSQLNDFKRMVTDKEGMPQRQWASESRLVVGPWTHLMGVVGDGEKDFSGAGTVVDQTKLIVDWFDHYLKGKKNNFGAPVQYFSIGGKEWQDAPSWPPFTRGHRLYFQQASKSPTCDGGRLDGFSQPNAESVQYVYDPRNPVPTRGGGPLLSHVIVGFGGPEPSNRDQAGLCDRQDVLSFMTPPLKEALHVAGEIQVSLSVSSSAEDTAFTAKVIEVDEKGKALNIQDGITTVAHARQQAGLGPYVPGEKTPLTFSLWPLDWVAPKGARIRVDISSSNFPAYHAHANRRGPWAQQDKPIEAKQRLFVGADHLSYIEFPIVASELAAQNVP
jgi:uncharacterized protein